MAIDRIIREASAKVRESDPDAVADRLSDHVVVDVREPREVLYGYLPGAVNVPRGTIEFRVYDDLRFQDRAQPILVYSGKGQRSVLAALTLRQLGFSNVTSLTGGLSRWSQERRPVE